MKAGGETETGSLVTLIIPAYNEDKTIGNVISCAHEVMNDFGLPYEVIVIDDCSTDRTRVIASGFNVTVIANKTNRGKGYCLRKGLEVARGNIIVTLDSDGEHKPKEIPGLVLSVLRGFDIVAGSRFIGKQSKVTTRLNQLGNSLFNITIMTLTGRRITDSQTGFRAIRRSVLDALNLESDGYEIETEITVKGLRNGFSFKELPITTERRKYSTSKIKVLSDGRKIMRTILRAGFS